MAKAGIRKLIEDARNDDNPEVIRQSDKELDVLETSEGLYEKNNLEHFYDIWQKYKGRRGDKNGINSWTAYALGMTSVEPEGEFLPARRAYCRAGFPDIDTDFDDSHRQDVYDYIIDKYGRDNVANIGTYGVLKTRSCLTRVIKALDIADAFHKGKDEFVTENMQMVNEILDPLPSSKTGKMKLKDQDGNDTVIKTVKDAYRLVPQFKYYLDKYPDILKHSRNIEGIVSNFGIHASGIVISDIPLSSIAPLRRSRKIGFATQFAYEDLESLGLIKFDVLAIATLTVIKKTTDLIEENYGIKIDIENLPLDDRPTLDLYTSGKLAGVFQCESYPMQQTMVQIVVDKFDDVMAAIALFRPGPMDSIPDYCSRKHGHQKVDYFHPSIEPHVKPYLEKTYGILVYQEQVMQICNSLAGFSKQEGYVVIKGIGKKKVHIINKYKNRFIEGCVDKKVPKDVAEQYWEKFITPFASYGFNASHSCCYGFISWITAYLKANYPDEFACSFLNTELGRANYDKIEMMEKDVKHGMDIKILSKTINDCDVEYTIVRKKDPSMNIQQTEIRPSLTCKGLGVNAAANIVENRPYKDIKELAQKTNTRLVDSDGVSALIDNGYFKGSRGIKIKDQMIDTFVMIRADMKKSGKKGLGGIQDLFD